MTARITCNKRQTYHTKSNLLKRFRTPGGKLKFQKIRKVQSPVVCGDTQVQLNGLKRLRRTLWKNAPKRMRTVSRVYGGCLSAEAVKHRIMRAFFNEELKCIKQGAIKMKKGLKKRTQKKRN
jgi:large subunit ribosomal protein L34e